MALLTPGHSSGLTTRGAQRPSEARTSDPELLSAETIAFSLSCPAEDKQNNKSETRRVRILRFEGLRFEGLRCLGLRVLGLKV
jgi:hypothetical protein